MVAEEQERDRLNSTRFIVLLLRSSQRRSDLDDPLDVEEQRIRAVLQLPKSASAASLAGKPGRPGRHRFVRDGEVPVTVVNPRPSHPTPDREIVAGLERALAAERQGRSAAEKALEQAREMIRQLQTRLAHATIAQEEAAPAPIQQAPQPEPVEPPTPPQRRDAAPDEDETVDWWIPGWRERFRARQQDTRSDSDSPADRPPQP